MPMSMFVNIGKMLPNDSTRRIGLISNTISIYQNIGDKYDRPKTLVTIKFKPTSSSGD